MCELLHTAWFAFGRSIAGGAGTHPRVQREVLYARASRYRYCYHYLDRVRLEADFLLGSIC
jgi:hypothetical protein